MTPKSKVNLSKWPIRLQYFSSEGEMCEIDIIKYIWSVKRQWMLDFFKAIWDNDINDRTLSQICENLAKEKYCIWLCDFSLNLNEDGRGDINVSMDTGQELVVKVE